MERRTFLGALTGTSLGALLNDSFAEFAREQNTAQAGGRVAAQRPFETSQVEISGNTVFVRSYGKGPAISRKRILTTPQFWSSSSSPHEPVISPFCPAPPTRFSWICSATTRLTSHSTQLSKITSGHTNRPRKCANLAAAAALLEFELCSYVAFGLLKSDKKECTWPACLILSRFEK
jgi:hypothetical protein